MLENSKSFHAEIYLSRCYNAAIHHAAATILPCAILLTGKIVPLVHSEEPASSDCDHSRISQPWLGVGCHMSDRRVGGKL